MLLALMETPEKEYTPQEVVYKLSRIVRKNITVNLGLLKKVQFIVLLFKFVLFDFSI